MVDWRALLDAQVAAAAEQLAVGRHEGCADLRSLGSERYPAWPVSRSMAQERKLKTAAEGRTARECRPRQSRPGPRPGLWRSSWRRPLLGRYVLGTACAWKAKTRVLEIASAREAKTRVLETACAWEAQRREFQRLRVRVDAHDLAEDVGKKKMRKDASLQLTGTLPLYKRTRCLRDKTPRPPPRASAATIGGRYSGLALLLDWRKIDRPALIGRGARSSSTMGWVMDRQTCRSFCFLFQMRGEKPPIARRLLLHI